MLITHLSNPFQSNKFFFLSFLFIANWVKNMYRWLWNNYKMLSVTCSIKKSWNSAQCSALGYRQHRVKQIVHCQNKLEKLTIQLVLWKMCWPKKYANSPQKWGLPPSLRIFSKSIWAFSSQNQNVMMHLQTGEPIENSLSSNRITLS